MTYQVELRCTQFSLKDQVCICVSPSSKIMFTVESRSTFIPGGSDIVQLILDGGS